MRKRAGARIFALKIFQARGGGPEDAERAEHWEDDEEEEAKSSRKGGECGAEETAKEGSTVWHRQTGQTQRRSWRLHR